MRYEEALQTGKARAEEAAEILRRWTGIKAYALFAVNRIVRRDNPDKTVGWEPVGSRSWKEIIPGRGKDGCIEYHLAIVDHDGIPKACSARAFGRAKAMRLAEKLPLSIFAPGKGILWESLEQKHTGRDARYHALHVEA